MKQILFFTCCLLFLSLAMGSYNLPSGLDSLGQESVARGFGFGSATRMNLDPNPLGGYEGFQVSFSRDFIDVSRLKSTGRGSSQDDYFMTSTLMVGKGLFYNLDSFFQMTPPQNDDFSSYGGLIRGTFWNSEKIDLHGGALVHGSLSQFANRFGSNIFGFDLYAYLNLGRFTILAGLGQAKGIYTFMGSGLVTPVTTENTKVDLTAQHLWSEISYHFGQWIASAVTESYFDSSYSLKLAYNF